MAFTQLKYESDSGDIHPVRVSSSYVAAIGAEPAGAISNDINARTRKGNREFGLRVRGWRVFRTIGSGDDQFRRYAFIPKMTSASWNAAPSGTITAGGESWTFLSRVPEDID